LYFLRTHKYLLFIPQHTPPNQFQRIKRRALSALQPQPTHTKRAPWAICITAHSAHTHINMSLYIYTKHAHTHTHKYREILSSFYVYTYIPTVHTNAALSHFKPFSKHIYIYVFTLFANAIGLEFTLSLPALMAVIYIRTRIVSTLNFFSAPSPTHPFRSSTVQKRKNKTIIIIYTYILYSIIHSAVGIILYNILYGDIVLFYKWKKYIKRKSFSLFRRQALMALIPSEIINNLNFLFHPPTCIYAFILGIYNIILHVYRLHNIRYLFYLQYMYLFNSSIFVSFVNIQ